MTRRIVPSFKARFVHALICLCVALGAGAAAAQTPSPISTQQVLRAPVVQPAQNGEQVSLVDGYVIGIGDVIEVSVIGQDEYKGRVQIQADGSIQLPFIGEMQAVDRTLLQIRDEVRRRLIAGGYYADPAVQVSVSTYASRYVIVLGAVATPGLLPVDRAYRLSEVIARVGGLRENGSDEVLLRRETGEEYRLRFDQIAMGGPNEDPVVNPGDKVFVPEAKTFYIYGQVNSPGNYRMSDDMSLQKALARAGGLTSLGSEGRIKVVRDGVELKKFKLGDPILPDDVIVVGERFF